MARMAITGFGFLFGSVILHLTEADQIMKISQKLLTFGYLERLDNLMKWLLIGKVFHIGFLMFGIIFLANVMFKNNK